METLRSYETSVNVYQITWRHIPDDCALYGIMDLFHGKNKICGDHPWFQTAVLENPTEEQNHIWSSTYKAVRHCWGGGGC
jgi:hypothetical protein